ncbi:MAG: hypothetical protein B7Y80_09440 [Hyphomicrobium sp. 32-62-53]|nr:MAG: hypothetical protein B7Y80_09440 [Hyphomicrobium sp. 32-62-53]
MVVRFPVMGGGVMQKDKMPCNSSAAVEIILEALEHHLQAVNGNHHEASQATERLEAILNCWGNNGRALRKDGAENSELRVQSMRTSWILDVRRWDYAMAIVQAVRHSPGRASDAYRAYKSARSAHDSFAFDFLKDPELTDFRQCFRKAEEVSQRLDQAVEVLSEADVESWSDLLALADAAESEIADVSAIIGTRTARLFPALLQGIRTLSVKVS